MPIISIITPLHNKGPYVAETICSVLIQTMPDWELIVVENGSTDNGPEVVRQFADDARIRLVVSPQCGPSAARNFGLGLAVGEWVLFLDADDLIEPNYLLEAINCGINAKADLVVSRWQRFIESPTKPLEVEHPACEGGTHAQLLDSAIVFTPWQTSCGLVKRKTLVQELLWPEQMDKFLGEDTVFWFSLLMSNPAWVSRPVVGVLYRWKPPGCRTQNEDTAKWFAGTHKGTCENLRLLTEKGIRLTPAQAENLMRHYEGHYLLARRTGNPDVAKESLRLARQWLAYCFRSFRLRPALLCRRVLGFHIFNSIKKCVRSQN